MTGENEQELVPEPGQELVPEPVQEHSAQAELDRNQYHRLLESKANWL
jgi:hypothetical protein